MIDACTEHVLVGTTRLRVLSRPAFGLVVDGGPGGPSRWLDAVFADPDALEGFFQLVEAHGLIVARDLEIDPTPYRRVRGRRSRGRLSQGELFHHDGCSAPTPPRVVEIRCPFQEVLRGMGTTIAPFPAVVDAMLAALPASERKAPRLAEVLEGEPDLDRVQGGINRVVRAWDAERTRAWFAEVESGLRCYRAPWTFGESRFMANGPIRADGSPDVARSVQHRRACHVWEAGTPNGHLIKRWPAEPDLHEADEDDCEVCARGEARAHGFLVDQSRTVRV